MQEVISRNMWSEIRKRARASSSRKAAIAYVTRDLIGFKKGDVLILDASVRAVRNAETDARLLMELHKRGVRLYACDDLHAKILLLDDLGIIGSANMSLNSAGRMVEAALVSNDRVVVAGVASLIAQLGTQSRLLDERRIKALCKIEVLRRGSRHTIRSRKGKTSVSELGNRTWVVGVRELARDPSDDEKNAIERATHSLKDKFRIAEDDVSWIKWWGNSRFRRECREGDTLIQIWRSKSATRPSAVLKAVPVLLRQRTKNWTRFYTAEPSGRSPELTWGRFKKLMKEAGHPREVRAGSVQLIAPEVADAIHRKWNSAAKR